MGEALFAMLLCHKIPKHVLPTNKILTTFQYCGFCEVIFAMLPVSASVTASETFIIENPSFKRFLIITHTTIPFPSTIKNPTMIQIAANIPAPVMLHSSHWFKVTFWQSVEAWLEQKAGNPQSLDWVRLMYTKLLLEFSVLLKSGGNPVAEFIFVTVSKNSWRSSGAAPNTSVTSGVNSRWSWAFSVRFDSHVVVVGVWRNGVVKNFALDPKTACLAFDSLCSDVVIFDWSVAIDNVWKYHLKSQWKYGSLFYVKQLIL